MADYGIPAESLTMLLRNKDYDIKKKSLEYVRYLSPNSEKYKDVCFDSGVIRELIVLLVSEFGTELNQLAVDSLINISSVEEGALSIFNADVIEKWKSMSVVRLINITLDQNNPFAEYTASVLINMTTFENLALLVAKVATSTLINFHPAFQAIYNKDYNKKCHNLSQCMCQFFGNLAQSQDFQKYLLTAEDGFLFFPVLPVIIKGETTLQKRGMVSTVYNCLFNTQNHSVLLNQPFCILPYLLYPLAGPEEFDDEIVEKMPIELQYLESDKEREKDPEIRTLLLKSLLMLCATRSGRVFLRDHEVYPILREYHKWEKDPSIVLACENVVDILIRTEDEIGVDNLKGLNVPDDLKEKFDQMTL